MPRPTTSEWPDIGSSVTARRWGRRPRRPLRSAVCRAVPRRTRCRGTRCRRQCVGDRDDQLDDGCVSGHVGAVDADGSRGERRRADVRDAFLERVHGQRRCGGLPNLPQRLTGRHVLGHDLRGYRPIVATSYLFGVAALDAAGNVSGTATKSVSTPACIDTRRRPPRPA